MNACVAAQIKTIREQRQWTQADLAERIGTKQAGISRLENVNYDAWKVETLTRIARAFDVRLRISFEEFDSLIDEVERFGRHSLERDDYETSKERWAISEECSSPSENLLRALDPTRPIVPKKEPSPRREARIDGEIDATNIDSARKSFRVLIAGRTDAGDWNSSPEPRGLSGGEVPVPKEPEYAARVQSG
jgi:transcriptional regulator with XRE-family HTH domain